MFCKPTTSQGFTLTEAMVTLALFATIATFAAPSFSDLMIKYRIKAQTDQLYSALYTARIHAVDSRHQTVLCPSTDGFSCNTSWEHDWILFEDRNENKQRDTDEPLISTLSGSHPSISTSYHVRHVAFSRAGSTSNFGTFTICPPDRSADKANAVILSISGRPRYAVDSNNDGIKESGKNSNISCAQASATQSS
ncbi:hypothetical protein C4K68_15940 [Pokkaliibacter plantistimulans]|uniref:Type II secretion system protein H n=1 Tax=Proteobacteria bacterium 228 TaxID=2083153 RepID=A0A2S5KNH1_9PROT|nr:GspH/FimT family pseudopilin [Pokkaliibacter plantistimulans]PPC76338.1 hypothetical protein C4K68_15940 [Pokkaliibacter plantistimulans]